MQDHLFLGGRSGGRPTEPTGGPPLAPTLGRLPGNTQPDSLRLGTRDFVTSYLSPRDLSIIHAVSTFNQLTSAQLTRLFFAENAPKSRARKARDVLARLDNLDEIKRIEQRVIGGWASGSQGFTYYVPDKNRNPQARNHHTWAIAELYVSLVEASRLGLCELVEYLPEVPLAGYRCIPDAQVELIRRGKPRTIWIEVDRSLSHIPEKISQYDDVHRSWRKSSYPAIFFTARTVAHKKTIEREINKSANPGDYRVCLFEEMLSLLV